jgi:4-aminobutyrate aminotransferase-like enzyme/Ser/Thr protein kinase RdoA (MazF antagonist)
MSSHDFLSQPLLTRPVIATELAAQVATEHFGIEGELSELASNQERNFLIDSPSGKYVLKIANPAFSDGEVEVQDAALLHLAAQDADLLIPRPHRAATGATIARFEVNGVALRARLLDFVPGFALSDSGYLAPAVVAALGALVGRVSAGLTGFEHPGLERNLQWDARNSREVGALLLGSVTDHARAQALRIALERSCDRLDSLAPQLRVQAVHGDASDDNVVAVREADGRPRPIGVIDFGDMSTSWVVGELAATCASVLAHDPSRPLAVLPAIRAFHAAQLLTEVELDALWPAIVARTVILVTSGLHQGRTDPGNAYAEDNQRREWLMFQAANSLPAEVAHAAIRSALGLPALVPRPDVLRVPAVAGEPGGRLLPALTEADTRVLDLSITTQAMYYGSWLEDAAELSAARRLLAFAPAAVARYGDVRLTRTRTTHRTEPDTFALGTEVFCAPGTQVLAPFDGVLTGHWVDAETGVRTAVLADAGVELILTGIAVSADLSEVVSAGTSLGVVDEVLAPDDGTAVGRVFVQLCTVPGLRPPQFVPAAIGAYWAAVCPDPAPLLGFGAAAPAALSGSAVLEVRERALAGVQEHYYVAPPRIERGWRHHLIDVEGRSYVDMINNVAGIGHANPHVTRAATRQLDLLNTNSRFNYLAVAAFSRRLAALLPDPLDTVFLVNSGSEAVDLALRLARTFTGREDVVCVAEAYHGWTLGSDAVSTSIQDNPRALGTRPAWVRPVVAPNEFRGAFRGPQAVGQYAERARQVIAELVAAGRPPAAFIAEAFYGNAGGVALPEGYLAEVYAAIRAAGGLCIADEVQVGYGRLGAHFWGFEQQAVVPDIVTIAKAMGNGYPLGAVITTREVADAFARDGYFFSSAGGSPVSCEIGSAVLDVIEQDGLQHNAAVVGEHLSRALRALMDRHQLIGAVHGMGLYIGVEFVRDRDSLEPATAETALICERLLELGVIVQPTGDHLNVLKIKPPLTMSHRSADFFVAMLDEVLTEGW